MAAFSYGQIKSGAPIGSIRPVSGTKALDEAGRAYEYVSVEQAAARRRWAAMQRDKRNFTFTHMQNIREVTADLSNKYCGYILLLQPSVSFDTNVLASGNKPLKHADFARIWSVSVRTVKTVLAEFERRSIVFLMSDKSYVLNERYHFRRRVSEDVDALIKTYSSALQRYKLSAADLGAVYKLLPHVHYTTNWICADPFSAAEDIRFLAIGEVAELLGMDESKARDVLKRLGDVGIAKTLSDDSDSRKKYIALNPYVFCRKRSEVIGATMALFKNPAR